MLNYIKIVCVLVFILSLLAGCGNNGNAGTSPTIANVYPASAPVGATVTITGTNFSTTPANNLVSFHGTAAVVTSCTSTQIVTSVPAGVTTGPITVTVGGKGATTVTSFNVSVLIGGSIQGLPTSSTGAVTTFAGTVNTLGATDGTGTTARFNNPTGITTDGTNLYVADNGNDTIRQIVIATGAVTTLAGTAGIIGAADGIDTAARFHSPYGITTDGTNLYVTDANNNTIRQIVIATKAVTTLAGTAFTTGSADGTGAAARFNYPTGITTDGTNLYVAEAGNNTIRKIVIATGVVTTLAGTAGTTGSTDGTGAAASFWGPAGITTDGTSLYVGDHGNNTIRKIVITTGVVTTLVGTAGTTGSADGTGTAARFNNPLGITTDGTNLFVNDTWNCTVRKIVITTGVVTTLAGTIGSTGSADGTGAAASFVSPVGITTDGTNLFITDSSVHTIRKIQ